MNSISKFKLLAVSLLIVFGFSFSAFAQTTNLSTERFSVFKEYINVAPININIPTVVGVPMGKIKQFIGRKDLAVVDIQTGELKPYMLISDVVPGFTSGSIQILSQGGNHEGLAVGLFDKNSSTYVHFYTSTSADDLPEHSSIIFKNDPYSVLSAINLILDSNSALPDGVEIIADGKVVLRQDNIVSTNFKFPITQAVSWQINLTHSKPIRVQEIDFPANHQFYNIYEIRFLAEPNTGYQIYFNADEAVTLPQGETGRYDQVAPLMINAFSIHTNPLYVKSDSDDDGIDNEVDNCSNISNPDQADVDKNSQGDACEDFDKDGLINSLDNCSNDPNRNQADEDGDKIGDVCDGVESRLTEMFPWLPWLGIVIAGFVLLSLFIFTLKYDNIR